jgi:hypothetical protein
VGGGIKGVHAIQVEEGGWVGQRVRCGGDGGRGSRGGRREVAAVRAQQVQHNCAWGKGLHWSTSHVGWDVGMPPLKPTSCGRMS